MQDNYCVFALFCFYSTCACDYCYELNSVPSISAVSGPSHTEFHVDRLLTIHFRDIQLAMSSLPEIAPSLRTNYLIDWSTLDYVINAKGVSDLDKALKLAHNCVTHINGDLEKLRKMLKILSDTSTELGSTVVKKIEEVGMCYS